MADSRPSLKLATNTELFERQNDDMDINCGTIADGAETLAQKGEEILQRVIATASGELSVANYYSSRDGQLVPASAVTLPAARIQVCKPGSYLCSYFTGSVAIQSMMAPLFVVELSKAGKRVL